MLFQWEPSAALGLRWSCDWGGTLGYRGAELARLRDADHSRLAEWLTRRLETTGWVVVPEASFNHYGDRGRIDLLAFHSATATLVVVEVKTVIADIQDLLGALNTKNRVAPTVARSLGWRAARSIPFLVVAATTTNRRRLVAHARLFAGLGLRGKGAVAWLRQPEGAPSGLLLLVKLPNRNGVGVRRAGRQRVRHPNVSASVDPQLDRLSKPAEPA
jgi:hypothetical protein